MGRGSVIEDAKIVEKRGGTWRRETNKAFKL